jgi:hypothetical protein
MMFPPDSISASRRSSQVLGAYLLSALAGVAYLRAPRPFLFPFAGSVTPRLQPAASPRRRVTLDPAATTVRVTQDIQRHDHV